MRRKKILIVGGGISGLTLLRALQRDDHDVELIEKNATLRADGAGITLSINAMKALDYVGLSQEIAKIGQPISTLSITDQADNILSVLRTDNLSNKYKQPMIAIHRERLHGCLSQSVDFGGVQLGVSISSMRPLPDLIEVTFSNGNQRSYDYIIGADGIASHIRSTVYPNMALRYSGYTCWRFVVDFESYTHDAKEMWGRGKRFGIVPIGNGQIYVFVTMNAPAKATQLQNISITEFKKRFQEFDGLAKSILDRVTDTTKLLHNDLCDLPRVCLGKGRILLIGDAAHASTPNLGQGAAMGIEDAVALACILRNSADSVEIEQRYLKKREQRVTNVRDRSFSFGKIAQLENSFARKLRNTLVKITPERAAQKNIEKMLFNYEPCLTNDAY